MRALHSLGLLDQVEYLAGISGGSWFATAFTFDQRTEYNTTERLCPYYPPADLDAANLETMPEACLGAAPQKDLYVKIAEFLAEAELTGDFYTLDEVRGAP